MLGEIRELGSLLHNYKRAPHELLALQNRRLRTLIHHAYERVPYYRALFDGAGIKPQDIRSVQDLARIPITTKRALRSFPLEHVIASGTDAKSLYVQTTGGTTGEPMKVFLSSSDDRARRLADLRALVVVGLRPWDRVAIFGPHAKRSRRLIERFGLFRTELIPGSSSIEVDIQQLRKFNPTILWAHAHALEFLMNELHGKLSSVSQPRLIITSAENRSKQLSSQVDADLGVEMFNSYGAAEAGRIAQECPAHLGMHVNCDRIIVECVKSEMSTEDGMCSAVVTVLDAFAMPFIRYHLGDSIAYSDHPCTCGSFFPLIRLEGREWDLFVLPSGRRIGLGWLNAMLRSMVGIEQYRVIQQLPDYVQVQLSFKEDPSSERLDALKAQIAGGFREPIRIEIEITRFLPDPRRRFKLFVSKVESGALETIALQSHN
jgi:phenylacetate-coenzyme A ligase PaaK-like adenylate-forming protein